MYVFDEINREYIDYNNSQIIVVEHTPDCIIFGYTSVHTPVIVCKFKTQTVFKRYYTYYELLKDILFFNNKDGCYTSKVNLTVNEITIRKMTKGKGDFPYSFTKRYEAIESFYIFRNRQKVLDNKSYKLSEFMPYTFGLEFETSCGYVPENICFRDGLIPLRDGSIQGLEYSTVVLQGNQGLNLLTQQIETLKEYTEFDKDCSLHVHMGGFPLDPDKIFNLYILFFQLQYQIENLVPKYTFNTSQYKSTGKDYCKMLKLFNSFDKLYQYLTGKPFYGNLFQPHPNDIERRRKWQINTRYFCVNFINLICYDINKTIEFRFLRPTYNINKIILWLYIFNAILRYAETNNIKYTCDRSKFITLEDVLFAVYPIEITNTLIKGLEKLQILTKLQTKEGDYIGELTNLEYGIFYEHLD